MNHNKHIQDAFSDGAMLFAQGKFEESICHFSRVIEMDPKLRKAYMSRGVAWVKSGNADKAGEDFEKAIELDPKDPRGYHFRALTHLKKGEREKAKADFDKAIELDDRYGAAYFGRGTSLSEMGDLDRAGKDMEMAARIGEAHLQRFADHHNIWRTKFDKVLAYWEGDRPADIAMTPDLKSWYEELE
jgi:tetratricopeptide (TPR) repeat protein